MHIHGESAEVDLIFVHVSDIHFGQEKGAEIYVHDDVKDCLIADVKGLQVMENIDKVHGVIVTGDVAFSGKVSEYRLAGEWLDRLTEAIGCRKTDVMVVPGNHDIDRDKISDGAALMLEKMIECGDSALHGFLADEVDRESLYAKFANFRAFAEGYGCGLEPDGGVALEKTMGLAGGRNLRFIGLNSALLCGVQNEEGRLLLGGKQRVIARKPNHEVVVLCHHPLESLQDCESATQYIRSRARVLIYGHVHKPSFSIQRSEENGDLLTLSAGAVVPPSVEDGYTYTYNLIRFEIDALSDGLRVRIKPRRWNEEATRFDSDSDHIARIPKDLVLNCGTFDSTRTQLRVSASRSSDTDGDHHDQQLHRNRGNGMSVKRDLLVLRFFRDLTAKQRMRVLIEVGVLTESWTIKLTHGVERKLLYKALETNNLGELEKAVAKVEAERLDTPMGER